MQNTKKIPGQQLEKTCNMIKDYRKAAGLTQKEFSELFEIPIDVIKSWDAGRREPPKWAEKLIIEKLEQIKTPR